MKRWRMSSLLITFNLCLVAAAIVLVGVGGVSLLSRLADRQALAEVRLASTSALQAVERGGERLLVSAELLGDRPTLVRLTRAGERPAIAEFLEGFRKTGGLDGCLLTRAGEVLATAGPPLPWKEIDGAAAGSAGWTFYPASAARPVLLVAWSPLAETPNARALAVTKLDDAYAAMTGEKFGYAVAIHPRERIESRSEGAVGSLRLRALESANPVAGRVGAAGAYLSAVALRAPGGDVVGVIEASIPTAQVDASIRGLARTLGLLAAGVGILTTLFSLFLARRIARPLETLTEASARIGRGDFETPVPRGGHTETAELATAMEEMRGRVRDLTADLRRERAEAEAVLTGIVEGVFAVDRERRIRYMNPQTAELLGIRGDDALGLFCGDVLRPVGRGGERPCDESCPIVHARFRGKARATECLETAGGKRRTVVITSAPPVGDAEGSDADARQFQVVRDETEVEATRRLRDTVLANISHEFRTPLSAQLASLELLKDRLPDVGPPEVQELVLSIERGTLRLTRLIDNLLESTRIEAGQDSLRRQTVHLDQVVEEAIEAMAPLLDQREQSVEVDLPYPLAPLTGDPTRLAQVFVNLIANANKFAPSNSTIGVAGVIRGDEIHVWVEDEGPGLPPGMTTALFEPFTRSGGDEPAPRGTGLGLFIVKSIIGRHGGRVVAESRGIGTRITVILPLGERHEDPGR